MAVQTIGRYQLKGKLGEGAMAVVLRAYDPLTGRDVALKVLRGRLADDVVVRQRFLHEARTAAGLEHPAVVPVYDAGQDGQFIYLVMRVMEGGTLLERMEKEVLPTEVIIHVLRRVGSALDAAHRRGIIHRDVKPDNILFDQQGQAYLADFGIVKIADKGVDLSTDMLLGTPAYMSPEQVKGGETVDKRSDLYSLGVVLFEMLTGELPYHGDTPVQMAAQHLSQPTPHLRMRHPYLPKSWERVVRKAMAKEKGERYQSGAELAEAFATASTRHRLVKRVTGQPVITRPHARRPRAFLGFLTMLMFLFLAWGVWGIWDQRPPAREAADLTQNPLEGEATVVQNSQATNAQSFHTTETAQTAAFATERADTTPPAVASSLFPQATPPVVESTRSTATFVALLPTASPTSTPRPTLSATITRAVSTSRTPTPRAVTPTATVGSSNPQGAVTIGVGLPLTFERMGVWVRGDEPYGSFEASDEQVHSGSTAGKLSYNFPTTGDDYVVFMQLNSIPDAANTLDIWVYGNGSGHFLNAWVLDADGQTWQVPLGQILHTGWKQMTGYMVIGQKWPWSHINGNDNGMIDYPIQLRGLVLDDYANAYQGSGVIYVDDLSSRTVANPQLPGGTIVITPPPIGNASTPGVTPSVQPTVIPTPLPDQIVIPPPPIGNASTPGVTPSVQPTVIPTPPPLPPDQTGRILYMSGNTLMSTDPDWTTPLVVGQTTGNTCNRAVTTTKGATFEVYVGSFCVIGETINVCRSPDGLHEVYVDGTNRDNVVINVYPTGNPGAGHPIYSDVIDFDEGIRWSPLSDRFLFVIGDSANVAYIGGGYSEVGRHCLHTYFFSRRKFNSVPPAGRPKGE